MDDNFYLNEDQINSLFYKLGEEELIELNEDDKEYLIEEDLEEFADGKWYYSTMETEGDFDGEKHAFIDYPIFLINVETGVEYKAIGGYYHHYEHSFNSSLYFDKVLPPESYYLCLYDSNYADEFDVEGFSLFNEEEYKIYTETIEQLDFNDFDIYFGTNEYQIISGVDDLKHSLDWKKISEDEYNVIHEIVGSEYGLLTPRGILDDLFELPRKKK